MEQDRRYKTIGGELCSHCGERSQVCWKAPDELWEKIIGDKMGGKVCIKCFDVIAAANGFALAWECTEHPIYIGDKQSSNIHTGDHVNPQANSPGGESDVEISDSKAELTILESKIAGRAYQTIYLNDNRLSGIKPDINAKVVYKGEIIKTDILRALESQQ